MAKEFFDRKIAQAREFAIRQRMNNDANRVLSEVLRGDLTLAEAQSELYRISMEEKYNIRQFEAIFQDKLRKAPPPPPKSPL